MDRKLPARGLLLLPSLPYLASLALPADSRGALPGYAVVWIGSIAVAAGSLAALLYWLPNPLLWIGTYLLHRGRIKTVLCLGTVASLLALLPVINADGNIQEIIGSPANVAWLVSMHLLVVAGYLGPFFPRQAVPFHQKPGVNPRELAALRSEARALREASHLPGKPRTGTREPN
jgi:hypothetical protein